MTRLSLRLLYVEDDPDIRGAVGELLEEAGYDVRLAATAGEGLAALAREFFDLVITDYNLPDFNGARMLREAAETGSLRCESLILTGASVLDGTTGFRILRKPIDIDKFLLKVEEVLAPVLSQKRNGFSGGLSLVPREDRRLPTGVPGLDDLTGGGCLRETVTLVRGPPGSGKTTLGAMCAGAAAARGERVAFFGFEESRRLLLRNVACLQGAAGAEEAEARLRIECRAPELLSPEALLSELRRSLEVHAPTVVVIDSLSALAEGASPRRFRGFTAELAAMCREKGRSGLMTQTLANPALDGARASQLCRLADSIFELEHRREEGQLRRTLSVLKMRGSGHFEGLAELTIDKDGVQIRKAQDRR